MNKYFKILLTITFLIGSATIAQAQQVFVANLSGAQEVPAVSTSGKGDCKVVLNAAQTQITVNCNYSGLSSSANAGHIHGNGPVGMNANVLFSFGTVSGTSGTIAPPPITVTAQQVADLRTNKFYVNIHTANNSGGEIRGQLHVANATFDDYDGDGRTDLTVFRPSDGNYYSQLSLNGSLKAQNWGLATDTTFSNADFDGDGLADYAALRVDPNNGAATIFFLQSATNTLRVEMFGNVSLGDEAATGDFDGDGKFDLGIFRNGLWIYIESSTGITRYFNWGQSGDLPIQGDFDRDGKSDFAVVRNVTGTYFWYIRQSSNGQLKVVPFGQTGDFVRSLTDFDGDGATDYTVVRNNGGAKDFYTLRSSDGQVSYFRWGLSTDFTATGDFDGDGKTDYTVIRDQNNALFWYIYQSSNNQFRAEQWGLSSDR